MNRKKSKKGNKEIGGRKLVETKTKATEYQNYSKFVEIWSTFQKMGEGNYQVENRNITNKMKVQLTNQLN